MYHLLWKCTVCTIYRETATINIIYGWKGTARNFNFKRYSLYYDPWKWYTKWSVKKAQEIVLVEQVKQIISREKGTVIFLSRKKLLQSVPSPVKRHNEYHLPFTKGTLYTHVSSADGRYGENNGCGKFNVSIERYSKRHHWRNSYNVLDEAHGLFYHHS